MDYLHENPRSYKFVQGNIIGFGIKRKGRGDLGCHKLDDRVMTHNVPLANEKKDNKATTYSGWGPETPRPSLSFAGRRGNNDSNVAPLLTTRLDTCTHLLLNVMQSNRFLSHLILALS